MIAPLKLRSTARYKGIPAFPKYLLRSTPSCSVIVLGFEPNKPVTKPTISGQGIEPWDRNYRPHGPRQYWLQLRIHKAHSLFNSAKSICTMIRKRTYKRIKSFTTVFWHGLEFTPPVSNGSLGSNRTSILGTKTRCSTVKLQANNPQTLSSESMGSWSLCPKSDSNWHLPFLCKAAGNAT